MLSLLRIGFLRNNASRCSISSINMRWKSKSSSELAYLHNPSNRPLLEMTIGQLLEEAARRWPNVDCHVSIQQKGEKLTYSELLLRADRLAAGFRKLGLQKLDRLGIWGPNQLEWVVAFMAASRAGLIVAGINPFYRFAEIEYSIKKIAVKAVVTAEYYKDQNYVEMLIQAKKNCSSLEHVIVHGQEDHISGTRRLKDVANLANNKDVEAMKEEQFGISPYDGAIIQFTSGTTGNPKAALISHRSVVNNSRQAVTRLDTDGRKICLNVPFFHAFGLVMGIISPLHVGSTVVIENPTFNPVKSIEAIVNNKCSVVFGTPTMWVNMIDVKNRTKVKIDCLYTGGTGGAPASPNLYKRIRECLHLEHIKSLFGLTEATAIVNQSLRDEAKELTDITVGYISDDIEIKVINENDDIVPFGTPGQLCVKGYSTMIGYWNDDESTRKTFLNGGWLKTGDQYVLRNDGYGQIVGRLKDMLIRGGENIFPKEIEDFLETHPDIVEAHVFGAHDDVYGEEICACVRLHDNAKLTAKDIRNYAKGKISAFKIPRHIEFCEDFPKTTSGKIQKFKLKQQLEARGVIPRKPQNY